MHLTRFVQLPLSPALQQVIRQMGFERLTPIQALTIPPLLEGCDVIGQSKTGSGKTAAFAIALLEKTRTEIPHTQALVLSPTRELCMQVASEIRKLGRYKKNLHVQMLSGGRPMYLDLRPLEHGSQIVVGTPGRLLDHLRKKTLDLSALKIVILDEADRMLDMGFRDSMEQILKATPSERQTALFSATYPSTIEGLSKRYQKTPQRLTIESGKEDTESIEQLFFLTEPAEKPGALIAVLRRRSLGSTLVFCNQKVQVDDLAQHLRQAGYHVDKLHGGLEQFERERVMAKFRNKSTPILVATDVAARGIDISGLDAVINYDMPVEPEQYVHRIGRTGRAGANGFAVSFLMLKERPKLQRLELFLSTKIELSKPASLTANPVIQSPAKAQMDTLSIGGGRKEKLRPGDILGALTGDADISGDQVGKIEILDHISYVAIAKSSSSLALTRLRQGKIKGRHFIVQSVR